MNNLVNQERFAKNEISLADQKFQCLKFDGYNGTKQFGILGWGQMSEAEVMKNFEIIAKAGVFNAMTKDYSYLTRPSIVKVSNETKKAFGDD